jgi:non-heme chloroperoxidase
MRSLVLLATLVAVGASSAHAQSPAPPSVRFVGVEPGVRLEVVDWGGSGRSVVLLAGLGVTARGLDSFAGALASTFHVVGITRRGFAPSSAPPTGYLADGLADDVLAVLDTLRLQRPLLVGHSLAGEELSSIGSRFPDRVAGLVYLDAGYWYAFYDRAAGNYRIDLNEAIRRLTQLSSARPRDQARLITQLLETDLPALERSLRGRRDLLPAPRPDAPPAPPERAGFDLMQAILEGRQRYTEIRAPVLAIFALPHRMPPQAAADSASLRRWRMVAAQDSAQAAAFERGVPGARVLRIPNADHFVYRSHEAAVLRAIRDFAATLPP